MIGGETMNIKYTIYQVKTEKIREYGFMGYEELCTIHGGIVDMSKYNKVYSGKITANTVSEALEKLWVQFNTAHPADYRGRSLSVGDVVAIGEGKSTNYFYCDSFGWKVLTPEIMKL